MLWRASLHRQRNASGSNKSPLHLPPLADADADNDDLGGMQGGAGRRRRPWGRRELPGPFFFNDDDIDILNTSDEDAMRDVPAAHGMQDLPAVMGRATAAAPPVAASAEGAAGAAGNNAGPPEPWARPLVPDSPPLPMGYLEQMADPDIFADLAADAIGDGMGVPLMRARPVPVEPRARLDPPAGRPDRAVLAAPLGAFAPAEAGPGWGRIRGHEMDREMARMRDRDRERDRDRDWDRDREWERERFGGRAARMAGRAMAAAGGAGPSASFTLVGAASGFGHSSADGSTGDDDVQIAMALQEDAEEQARRQRRREAAAAEAAAVGIAQAVPADAIAGVMESSDLLKAILSSATLTVADLCRAACVNRLWRDCAEDPAFWRRVCLVDRRVTSEQVLKLCRRQRGVIEELRLGGSAQLPRDSSFLSRLLPNLNRLSILELRRCHLSDASFRLLSSAAQLPALRELMLEDVYVMSNHGPAQGDATLSHPGLTSLKLTSAHAGRLSLDCRCLASLSVTSSHLAALTANATTLPALHSLSIASSTRLSDQSLLSSLTTLRRLSLSEASVSEDLLRASARALEHLTQLELLCCTGVTLSPSRGQAVFLSLKRLVVTGCDSLSASTVGLLAEGCGSLEELVLDGCAALAGLSLSLGALRVVSLKGCRLLASLELKCRRLEELSLGSTEPGGPGGAVLKRVSVSSEALRAISWRHLPSLEELHLDCPGLTSLALADCDSLNDLIFSMLTDVEDVTLAPPQPPRAAHAAAQPHNWERRAAAEAAPGGAAVRRVTRMPLAALPAAAAAAAAPQGAAGAAAAAFLPLQLVPLAAPPPQPMGVAWRAYDEDDIMFGDVMDRDFGFDVDVDPMDFDVPGGHEAGAWRPYHRHFAPPPPRQQAAAAAAAAPLPPPPAPVAPAAQLPQAAAPPRPFAAAGAGAGPSAALAGGSPRQARADRGRELGRHRRGPHPMPLHHARRQRGPGATMECRRARGFRVGSDADTEGEEGHSAGEEDGEGEDRIVAEMVAHLEMGQAMGGPSGAAGGSAGGSRGGSAAAAGGSGMAGGASAVRRQWGGAGGAAGGSGAAAGAGPGQGAGSGGSGGGFGPSAAPLRREAGGAAAGGSGAGASAAVHLRAPGSRRASLALEARLSSPRQEQAAPLLPAAAPAQAPFAFAPAARPQAFVAPPQPQPAPRLHLQLPPQPQLHPQLHAAPQALALAAPQPQPQPQLQSPPRVRVVSVAKTGGCPRLQELRLEGCEGLRHAHLRHSRLVTISLRGCRGLLDLRLGCPALHALQLEECGELGVVALEPAGLESLSLGACCALREADLSCPVLERLSLKGCGSLVKVALDCPALLALDATFCGSLSDAALETALGGVPPLQELVLSVCSNLGPAAVPSALAKLAGLRKLDLSYTCVAELAPVLSHCSALTSLCLASCRDLARDDLLTLLPDQGNALPHLAELDVSYCDLRANVAVRLVTGLTRLRRLAMNGCPGVDDAIWRQVAAPAGPDSASGASLELVPSALDSLSLVRCCGLRSLCLGLEPEPASALPSVPSRGSPRDSGVLALSPAASMALPASWRPVGCLLSGLVSLRLGLSSVTVVALSLAHLTTLDLNGCSGLRKLELRCPRLVELHLQACCALPADLLRTLLDGEGAGGGGLLLLDAQHAGPFGEAVAAAVAAAALMAEVEAQEQRQGGGAGGEAGTSAGTGGGSWGPALGAGSSGAGTAAGSGSGGCGAGGSTTAEPGPAEAGATAGPSGDGSGGSGSGAGGSSGAYGSEESGPSASGGPSRRLSEGGAGGGGGSSSQEAQMSWWPGPGEAPPPRPVVTPEALLATRDTPWFLLPKSGNVLACSQDCCVCGRRQRRNVLGSIC